MRRLNKQHCYKELLILSALLIFCFFFFSVNAYARCVGPSQCFYGNTYCCFSYAEALDKIGTFPGVYNIQLDIHDECVVYGLNSPYLQCSINGSLPYPPGYVFVFFDKVVTSIDPCSGSSDICCGTKDPCCGAACCPEQSGNAPGTR